jgi:hypothetical protein
VVVVVVGAAVVVVAVVVVGAAVVVVVSLSFRGLFVVGAAGPAPPGLVVVVNAGDACACAGTTTDLTTGRVHLSGTDSAPNVPPDKVSCKIRRRSTVT